MVPKRKMVAEAAKNNSVPPDALPKNAEINFPVGSTLLAGDIGSGKSTILLAVEFAIFGAKKGELPAYTLLRHGKKEGYVELKMQIDNKDILIKRVLKKSNDDIKQEAG